MQRISKDNYYLNIAQTVLERSTCLRRGLGTTAATIAATSASFESSAEPAATLQTFFAGQPMLMSTTCAPCATL